MEKKKIVLWFFRLDYLTRVLLKCSAVESCLNRGLAIDFLTGLSALDDWRKRVHHRFMFFTGYLRTICCDKWSSSTRFNTWLIAENRYCKMELQGRASLEGVDRRHKLSRMVLESSVPQTMFRSFDNSFSVCGLECTFRKYKGCLHCKMQSKILIFAVFLKSRPCRPRHTIIWVCLTTS